jgi:hypothetical protein
LSIEQLLYVRNVASFVPTDQSDWLTKRCSKLKPTNRILLVIITRDERRRLMKTFFIYVHIQIVVAMVVYVGVGAFGGSIGHEEVGGLELP